ncbi:response regulator [Paenibacillus sp. TAB 01]|uniref:response regulator transcription factor n=1 Tax=Paenibacillus sp. TAB 01 TaxID=3368988 RepID=UPI0037508F06
MYKLLIADDESEIRNGLSSYFPWSEIGFEVVGQAQNGLEVLQCIAECHVDVILCDIKMPMMSGIEVAQTLFKQKSSIIIIFLSGYKEFEYAQQALIYGVKNYIVKPTKYSELFQVFSEIKERLDYQRNADPLQALPGLDEECEACEDASFSDKIIKRIKEHVEANFQTATLQSLSELVHMNPYYLSKYFKQKTGENFSEYILRVKMNKAAELLLDINYRTYEISEIVGYSNTKNFTRTFRKYYGKSPREFRNFETIKDDR